MVKLRDFDYQLPLALIAQKPHNPRDQAGLLKLDRKSGEIVHSRFDQIGEFLSAGDVLVINNSQVFKARLKGFKKDSGGQIEVFLHQEKRPGEWECLIKGRARLGSEVILSTELTAHLIKDQGDGTWLVRFNLTASRFWQVVDRIGQTPLPPYIQPDEKKKDEKRYQTVYANARRKGSVAAPTAGLHFTKRLLNQLESRGIIIVSLTLHVGLGTFVGVKNEDITKHQMHYEDYFISSKSLKIILQAKREKRRIIAVGTTSCRVLETVALNMETKNFLENNLYQGSTNIFIYPDYRFILVDALITNFHLPKSTLLMLVSAFAGLNNIQKAYQEAIIKQYRFYSYGDAMLII
ncbi:MAG: tRNA preQ1(34) S-adenosylmethionine ribosyltransferase-isomerase QueA [Clostridia bacterium]|nr:tRNA preQ1(34) S-adenosylmethionine ribosyltransferase-isomerase QueA [Clostridia bacterium]